MEFGIVLALGIQHLLAGVRQSNKSTLIGLIVFAHAAVCGAKDLVVSGEQSTPDGSIRRVSAAVRAFTGAAKIGNSQ